MGKSPAKWIKTVLFGKKSSKPNLSKGRERISNEKEVVVAAREVGTEFVVNPPVAIQESTNTIDYKGLELENKDAPNVLGDGEPGSQSTNSQGSTPQNAAYDPKKIRQEQAATKAQAAFRGYLSPIPVNNWVLCCIFLKKRGSGKNEEEQIQVQACNVDRVATKPRITRPVFYDFMTKDRANLSLGLVPHTRLKWSHRCRF